MSGDELIDALRALPADVRTLQVVYMDHDQCSDPFMFPVGMPQVTVVTDPDERPENGDRVIVL